MSEIILKFIGAAKTVTGSKTLLSVKGKNILIDCGLFQGPKALRELNWQGFSESKNIDAVLLTHAHIDHSGYLPRLVRDGYRGDIYCSKATLALSKIMLMDSARLQEEDAKFANESRHSRHFPALPLYKVQDAERTLNLFKPIQLHVWNEIFPGIKIKFLRSGHILGSSLIQISLLMEDQEKLITFSGDLGNNRQYVIKGPEFGLETDFLVLEGTYGDRVQAKVDPSEVIASYINKIYSQGGVMVIPAFAVGRTQEVLFLIRKLENENKIPALPVYLDSPMAIESTNVYLNHPDELNFSIPLNKQENIFLPKSFKAVQTAEDSMRLCATSGPMVVISAAGMLTGGRVMHHLKYRLPEKRNVVLLVGYTAAETKARLLQYGLPKIRIHHQEVKVAAEIVTIDSLSAHADTNDLVNWVAGFKSLPKRIFLNHGEEASLNALRYRLVHELNLKVEVPDQNSIFKI